MEDKRSDFSIVDSLNYDSTCLSILYKYFILYVYKSKLFYLISFVPNNNNKLNMMNH